jgi:hypothetical protein
MDIFEIIGIVIMNLFIDSPQPDNLEEKKKWLFRYLFMRVNSFLQSVHVRIIWEIRKNNGKKTGKMDFSPICYGRVKVWISRIKDFLEVTTCVREKSTFTDFLKVTYAHVRIKDFLQVITRIREEWRFFGHHNTYTWEQGFYRFFTSHNART